MRSTLGGWWHMPSDWYYCGRRKRRILGVRKPMSLDANGRCCGRKPIWYLRGDWTPVGRPHTLPTRYWRTFREVRTRTEDGLQWFYLWECRACGQHIKPNTAGAQSHV